MFYTKSLHKLLALVPTVGAIILTMALIVKDTNMLQKIVGWTAVIACVAIAAYLRWISNDYDHN